MNRKPIPIIARPWNEVKKEIPTTNSPLLDYITKVAHELGEEHNYVYQAELEFGDHLIKNGNVPIETFSVSGLQKTAKDLKEDLSYSRDPLGIVLSNHIEIYMENQSNKSLSSYPILLNEIKYGDFFGVFGALGYITDVKENKTRKSHWSAIAGNICLEVAYNWGNKGATNYLDNEEDASFFSERISVSLGKLQFFKKYAPKDWKVKIAYFPKRFLQARDELLRLGLENELLKIGWAQANPLKEYLFENKTVSDAIFDKGGKRYGNDRHLLSLLYDYILHVGLGERRVMVPISQDHVGFSILLNFRDANKKQFSLKGNQVPLLFKYDYLNEVNNWGLMSLNQPPFLFNHGFKDNELRKDIERISSALSDEIQLPKFEIFAYKDRDRLKENFLIPAFSKFINPDFYAPLGKSFCLNKDSIVTTDSKFSKLMVISKK